MRHDEVEALAAALARHLVTELRRDLRAELDGLVADLLHETAIKLETRADDLRRR